MQDFVAGSSLERRPAVRGRRVDGHGAKNPFDDLGVPRLKNKLPPTEMLENICSLEC